MLGMLIILTSVELGIGSGVLLNRPYLLALPLALPLVLGLSSRMEYGAVAVLFSMVAIKLGISTGTASKIPVSMVIAGLWGVLHLVNMVLTRNIRITRSSINLPALVFIAIVLVSTLWSRFLVDPQVVINDKFITVQIGTIGVTVISIVLAILCANLIRQAKTVKWCFWLFVGSSLFYLPFYIFESTLPASITSKIGPDEVTIYTLSRLINAGGLFPMWFCALCLSLLFSGSLSKWQRVVVAVAMFGWLFRLFVLTLVRISGWLPTLIALLVVLFIYSRKWFFILTILAAILIAFNFNLIYDAIVVSKEKEGTLAGDTSRTSLLQQALTVAKDHPVLGTGPAGYANYYLTYFRDLALSTHNNYLDMLLQYGLLGLGAYMWLCFALIKELWKASRLQIKNSFEHAFTLGAFAGAVAMVPAMWLGDWVIPFAYNQTIFGFNYTAHNWLWPGLALALGYIARERLEAEAQKEAAAKAFDKTETEPDNFEAEPTSAGND
jgi:O-antigen ligase